MSLAARTVETISPLYEQIVQDFLARVEKDEAIPRHVVKNLRSIFGAGTPKSAELLVAFASGDDIE